MLGKKNMFDMPLVTEAEMRRFCAIFIFSGYILPNQCLYWIADGDVSIPHVQKSMSRNRLIEIKRALYLAKNETLCTKDKAGKISPLYEILIENWVQFNFFTRISPVTNKCFLIFENIPQKCI